ncbi:hypothetical protein ACFPM1_13890 [Halorubrum rubrum]|uniref:Uncharacterized protein n=1 Tax=Halorubrum rubrum TaxID=1126240 RepID=A0ABD5R4V5_9EURY|nr:hypothetical protein [Halorubrum rubrum]
MTATPSSFGIDHPTVVPVNFDPERRDETDDRESSATGETDR